MRFAVSGSHSTGKSTLIAAFLEARPDYALEPEAFETLGDEVQLTDSEGATPEGLRLLLEHTLGALAAQAGERVVFERSPVDYLAYAAASGRSWPGGAIESFLATHVPAVREAIRRLDFIAYVPLTPHVPGRAGESPRFRKRVDAQLQRALFDDEHDLFGDGGPCVVDLSPVPATQLAELMRRTLV